MIKGDQSSYQKHIFIKMSRILLIILKMADSSQPHMYKLQSVVRMVDYHIRMSIPQINDEYYFSPVTELEDGENEE